MALILELPEDLSFLIVDESESFRNTMAAGLRTLGFKNVTQSVTSAMAFDVLQNKNINFVICELEMSGINGVELLKEVRDASDINKVAFLMISKNATKEDIALLAEYEIDGFLKKPFSFQTLAKKISHCMQSYNNEHSLENKFQEAKLYIKRNEYNVAIKKYEDILKIQANSCRARVGQAISHRMLKNYLKAEALCKQAIERNPMYVQTYDEIGKIYVCLNRMDEAIRYFNKAVSLSPNNPLRFERITNTLLEYQRLKEAELFMERALNNEVIYGNIYEQYGKILFYQKKLEKATLYFEKALERDPNNRSLINLMGVCLKDQNRFEDALKYYNIAIKYYPTDTKVLFNKALCFIEMREFDRAKKLFEYILTLDPENPKVIKKIQEIDLLPA